VGSGPFVDVLEVRAYGASREDELGGDFGVRQAGGRQCENFALARREDVGS